MRKIYAFMMVSLDGFFKGKNHDLSWHNVDAEFGQFTNNQAKEVDTIIMGRKTNDLMASFWPTAQTMKADPIVADFMNNTPKIVYSKTLKALKEVKNWKNVSLKNKIDPQEVIKIKKQKGKDIAIFGSNNLCVSFIKKSLIDELRIMVNPVILGEGGRLFEGLVRKNLNFLKPEYSGMGMYCSIILQLDFSK